MLETATSLFTLCAADIMTDHVVMIPREMSLQGAARLLARADVTGAPVVDESGRCIGVLSATDFMNLITQERIVLPRNGPGEMCTPWQMPDCADDARCVADVMTRDPVLVTPAVKISELARMMMDAHIHRLIVVDRVSQRPIGVVSSIDILAALARFDMAHAEEFAIS